MKHVHSGPLEVNRSSDAAPAADYGARFVQDRAAVITEPHDLEALAWSCGIDTEETYILAAPAAEPGARFRARPCGGLTEPHDLEALAWACGICPEEAAILAAPAAEPGTRSANDRAAVVTSAISANISRRTDCLGPLRAHRHCGRARRH